MRKRTQHKTSAGVVLVTHRMRRAAIHGKGVPRRTATGVVRVVGFVISFVRACARAFALALAVVAIGK